MALKKINKWAASGKLARHDYLLSILFKWRRWDDPKNVSSYAQSLIETDKGLIEFIKKFLYDVKSHGMKDYVGSVNQRINLENVETFVSLDEVDKRLREILYQPQYNELDDKEKLTIKTFIDTRDGKIKDRF